MAKQITFYYHKDCGFCEDLKPLVKKAAKMKGYGFKQVDVETCETKFCNALSYVPVVVLDGKKLSPKKIENFLS